MIYLDTSVIVSYVDEEDPNHGRAVELLGRLMEDRVASQLTLLELAAVYSRAGLPNPVSLAVYSLRVVGASLVDVDLNQVSRQALRYAQLLRLRTLDLLHVVAARMLGASAVASFDKEIAERAGAIREALGLEFVG
ncbi:type II toxin-antitoxin system VapC family toxin [Thermofilum pendens]|uniref:Ribonuclease VapC n=1 Tax=Thermofilum pendens (strain DSM 2475 / Hrk 5) TaxID=368408 RepID=A1S089_THEPD|nr:PIN domain-containing protein [Thermofilum pendens]ABL78869.1 PilT protein domain protein [Thermofilum pendens Hrk 5]